MLALWRGYPKQQRLDKGAELISQTLEDWVAEHEVRLAFIQPGIPTQDAFIERFNRMYREAVLVAYLLHTVAEVQALIEDWLEEYKTF
jgi:putative transposase